MVTTTPCIRCGKNRIFLKKWKDHGENGKGPAAVHTESICPDAECQKIVDGQFQAMRDRREASENRKKSIIIARSAKAAASKPLIIK